MGWIEWAHPSSRIEWAHPSSRISLGSPLVADRFGLISSFGAVQVVAERDELRGAIAPNAYVLEIEEGVPCEYRGVPRVYRGVPRVCAERLCARHSHMHAHIHTHTRTHAHTRTRTRTQARTRTRTHTHTHTHTHARTRASRHHRTRARTHTHAQTDTVIVAVVSTGGGAPKRPRQIHRTRRAALTTTQAQVPSALLLGCPWGTPGVPVEDSSL
jgi:hypothetical protein